MSKAILVPKGAKVIPHAKRGAVALDPHLQFALQTSMRHADLIADTLVSWQLRLNTCRAELANIFTALHLFHYCAREYVTTFVEHAF